MKRIKEEIKGVLSEMNENKCPWVLRVLGLMYLIIPLTVLAVSQDAYEKLHDHYSSKWWVIVLYNVFTILIWELLIWGLLLLI